MDPLKEIFFSTAKRGKDGKSYIFFKSEVDIAFLYFSGFVDAKKYKYERWLESFKPSRQADGSYTISEQQWMEKKKFHYTGPVDPPWDPTALEDKEYSEKEIRKIILEKVIPCTVFDETMAEVYLNNLKAQGRLVNGRGSINKLVKQYILQIINQYPSPMRVLQLSVHGLRKVKRGFTKAAQDQLQKSGFASGMTAQQIMASRLAELAGKTTKETAPPAEADKGPSISLKDLQRRKGTGRI